MFEQFSKQKIILMKEFVTTLFSTLNTDVKEVRKENEELRKSLDFAHAKIEETKSIVEQQKNKIKELEGKVCEAGEMSGISERVRIMEDFSKRNNIIIDGIPEQAQENSEKLQVAVTKLFSEKLGMPNVQIERCHRIGKESSDQKPRRTLLALSKFEDRQKCLKSSFKLKGSDIYVNEDVSRATAEIRRTRNPELLEKRRRGLIAYFSGVTIVTKKRLTPQPQQEQLDDKQEQKPVTRITTNQD